MGIKTIVILNMIAFSQAFVIYEETVFPCMFDSDCKDISPLAKCMNKICKCQGNCGYLDTTVVSKIGHPCNSLQDCNVDGAYCLDSSCACKVGTVASENKRNCLQNSNGIGSKCTENVQCSANVTFSICANNTCTCEANKHLVGNNCIANKSLGESCNLSDECTADFSTCDGTCKCVKRYVEDNKRCLLVSKTLYSPCENDIQCQETLGAGSHCVNTICKCHDLYHFKSKANKCIRDLLLGEICTDNEDCHLPGTGARRLECILGECKCRLPFFQVNDFCISSSSKLSLKFTTAFLIFRFIFGYVNKC